MKRKTRTRAIIKKNNKTHTNKINLKEIKNKKLTNHREDRKKR